MRKRSWILLLCSVLFLVPGCGQKPANAQPEMQDGKKVVKLTVQENSQYTSGTLAKAIDAINKSGALDVTLSCEITPHIDEETQLIQFKAGHYSDLVWNTNSDIGWMAYMGLIQPVDWVSDMEVFKTVPENLLKNITHQGHIYAVPNRTAVTAMYTNREALAALGWSADDIEGLPGKIEKGQWTMDDLSALAQQAVAKGLVKYGLIMDGGIEWHSLTALASTFGAYYCNEDQSKLVLNRTAWMNYFTWWQNALENNIVQKSQINMSKETVNKILSNHEALFFVSHEGFRNLYDHRNMDRADFENWFFSNFLISKIPSWQKGTPGTDMMRLYVMYVSSKTEAEKIPYIKEILNYLYSDGNQLQTDVYLSEFTLPVTEKAWQNESVKNELYISTISPFVNGATTWPTHPYFPYYLIAHDKVIEKMIVGGASAQEAYDMLKEELTYNVDSKELVVEN